MRDRVSYEGQAAVELESLAAGEPPVGSYPFAVEKEWNGEPPTLTLSVDTRPLICAVARDATAGVSAALIARRFHSSMIEIIADVCRRLREETGLKAVALSGGVFMNALLTSEACARLTRDGFRAYRHSLVPPNDGGLSLGQLAVFVGQASSLSQVG